MKLVKPEVISSKPPSQRGGGGPLRGRLGTERLRPDHSRERGRGRGRGRSREGRQPQLGGGKEKGTPRGRERRVRVLAHNKKYSEFDRSEGPHPRPEPHADEFDHRRPRLPVPRRFRCEILRSPPCSTSAGKFHGGHRGSGASGSTQHYRDEQRQNQFPLGWPGS